MSQKGNLLVRAFGVGNGVSAVTVAETTQGKGKRVREVLASKLFIFAPTASAKDLYKALAKATDASVASLTSKLRAKLGSLDSTPATLNIGGTPTPITITDRVGYHLISAELVRADKLAGVVDLVEEEIEVVS